MKEFITSRIQNKLLFFLLLVALVPVIIFAIFFVQTQMNTFDKEMIDLNEREVSRFIERVEIELDNIISVTNALCQENSLSTDLASLSECTEPASKDYFEDRILSKLNDIYPYFYGSFFPKTCIITEDGQILGDPFYEKILSTYKDFLPSAEDCFSGTWVRINKGETNYLLYVHAIPTNTHSNNYIGTAVTAFSSSNLYKILIASSEEYRSIYLINENRELLSYTDSLDLGTDLSFFTENSYFLPEDEYTFYENGREMLLQSTSLKSPTWKILLVTDRDVQLKGLTSSLDVYLLILIFYIVFLVAFAFWGAKSITSPIKNLASQMKKVQAGDLSVRAEQLTHDEIGELALNYNSMLDHIQELTSEQLENQKKAHILNMRALQSQIHPHFMYNTLASIRYMILAGDRKEADTMVLSLIKLLKKTLSNSSDFVSIHLEFEQVRDYIILQEHILNSNFVYHINVERGCEDFMTLKFILQPIVENAILHAFSRIESPVLEVSCRAVGTDVEFTVKDNGNGFNAQMLQASLLQEPSENGSSIGLRNVHQRIRLHFGDQYGINIESIPGIGTTVKILMPQIQPEKDSTTYEHFNC